MTKPLSAGLCSRNTSSAWGSGAALLIASLTASCGGVNFASVYGPDSSTDGGSTIDSRPTSRDADAPTRDSAADGSLAVDGAGSDADVVDSSAASDASMLVDAAGLDASLDSGDGHDAGIVTSATQPVALASTSAFAVLAETMVTTVTGSTLTGDLGISPAASTLLTGFAQTLDSSGQFAKSPSVTGKVLAADYVAPTPAGLTQAVADMDAAFADAVARTATFNEVSGGAIGALTLLPGVYHWSSPVLIASDVTLKGNATDVWIFQIAQTLTMDGSTHVVLSGGALAKNVFWQTDGAVTLAGSSHLEGVVLAQTSVALAASASVHGRILSQTAVTLAGTNAIGP
jgi:hypothetical protein